MSTKREKPITVSAIVEAMMAETPKATRLGKMAMKQMPKQQKRKPVSNHSGSIHRLEELQAEINKPRHRKKGKDVLERTPKEIVESALGELCAIYFQSTGYNPHWVRAAVEDNWQAGRLARHSYDKRIRCCQLIHLLKTKDISERQAMAIADQVYDFNKTDAKDSYYFFKRDLKKYYFPEIQFKAHIAIRIILDAIRYSRTKLLIVPPINVKAADKFEKIITQMLELFFKEIEFAKKEKLEKLGVEINPILKEFVAKNSTEFMAKVREDRELATKFAIYGTRFLNDLELYYELT